MTLKNKIDAALNSFNDGFACSQSILSAFSEQFGLDRKLALKISDPFGAGMRGLSETCGAVTGSLMVIGLKYGRTCADDILSKDITAELVHKFIEKFKERNETIICKKLIGYDISIPEQRDHAEALGLSKTRCPKFVRDAAEILAEIL